MKYPIDNSRNVWQNIARSVTKTGSTKRRGRGAAWLARRSVTPVAASSNLVVPANKRDLNGPVFLYDSNEFNGQTRKSKGVDVMRVELYNWRYESLAEQLSKEMKKRYFDVFIARSKEELLETVKSIIPEGASVSNGGSLTLAETGVLNLLRSGNYVYYDRASAQTIQERKEIELKSFTVDYYLSSANAITNDGKLVFLDGNGNRVAAVLYGPRNVVIIASVNKVVEDVENARRRLQFISPMNSKRLNLETPCIKTGYCVDCSNKQRICNYFVVVETSARQPGRIKVVLTTFESGL